ncbi:MAG: hypothetical protein IKN82_01145 [Treponema sp.]|nr:hypothetical protein [Treponema sp.]
MDGLPGFFFKGLEWSEAELFLQAHVAPRRLSGLRQFAVFRRKIPVLPPIGA